jgi:hypothetical protein
VQEANGTTVTFPMYLETQGVQNAKCVTYIKSGLIQITISDAAKQQMIEEYNITEAQIDAQLVAVNTMFALANGKDMTCNLTTTELSDLLVAMKDINTVFSGMDESKCTGPLLNVSSDFSS